MSYPHQIRRVGCRLSLALIIRRSNASERYRVFEQNFGTPEVPRQRQHEQILHRVNLQNPVNPG